MQAFLLGLGLAVFCGLAAAADDAKLWAVLVAGSDGYYNYRHQSDVCHAYQILKRHGIPDERIIVFMKDDIANSRQNPTPGVIINHPNGPNVYPGVPKDYTGRLVTPENFLKVLKGQPVKGGSGKALKSGPNDHVFINFVDHGATGILAFPDAELTSKQLLNALQYMNEKKRFGKLVFYVEACESGSMFQNILPNNINVYATTASNAVESSYACYFDNERGTYLGDVYSVKWMEDSDKENLLTETLLKQFQITKKETTTSHVQEYGDTNIAQLHVAEFQGENDVSPITYPKVLNMDTVVSWNVPLAILQKKHAAAKSQAEKKEIKLEIRKINKKRRVLTAAMKNLVTRVTSDNDAIQRLFSEPTGIQDLDCHHELVQHFSQNCLKLAKNPYAMKYAYILANICNEGIPVDIAKSAVDKSCATLDKEAEYL